MVQTPLKVQRVHFDDMGGGVLKVKAEGQFLAQGFSAMSGPNTLSPTTFDGTAIQFFANANNLLMADDLKLVAENGVATTLGVEPVPGDPAACDIEKAKFQAVPRPDGNSWVEVKITLGNKYDLNRDKAPNPLVLIGSQVYGLHETPFLRGVCASDSKTGVSCTYNFLASTSVLRSAQTYLLRDLSWTNLKKSGKIDFDPSFGSLTALVASSGSGGTDATATGERTPAIYTLSGTDLLKISHLGTPMCHTSGCLEVFEGLSPFYLNADNFQVSSPTNGAIAFGPQTPTPVISLKAKTTTIIISAGTNSNDAKQPPSPSLCPPASKGKAPAVCQPKKQQVAPTDQTQFFYTIDGSTPSVGPNSRLYSNTSPIVTASLQAPTVFIVKAIAVAPNQLPSPIAVGKFYKVTKTTILPQYSLSAPQSSFKSYRFVWHSKVGYPVEWDLSVPAAAAAATVTASTILNVGDSTEVDFSGVNVLADSASTPITFAFDDVLVPNPLFSYDATKKTLKLMITTAMTSKPGHKVIVMNGYLAGTDGNGTNKPTQVLLPFDVTRR